MRWMYLTEMDGVLFYDDSKLLRPPLNEGAAEQRSSDPTRLHRRSLEYVQYSALRCFAP